jgi:hypothetical protein
VDKREITNLFVSFRKAMAGDLTSGQLVTGGLGEATIVTVPR